MQGDQNDPAYMKLNPNGVVPTLVHDGNVVTESSLILYYIDEAFPEPPLMPKTPVARHRVRLYNKLIDEYMHNACTIITFATAFRPRFLKMTREQWLAEINKAPLKRRAEYKRSVIEHGLDSEFVLDALGQHQKLISWMAEDLKRGPYLAGEDFSNADCAVDTLYPPPRAPEARRACGRSSRRSPTGGRGCEKRPSVKAAVFDRMKEADWAPFRNLSPDPVAESADFAQGCLTKTNFARIIPDLHDLQPSKGNGRC